MVITEVSQEADAVPTTLNDRTISHTVEITIADIAHDGTVVGLNLQHASAQRVQDPRLSLKLT